MKYRIVEREDIFLSQNYYYVQMREHFWNSWTEISTMRFRTLEAAKEEINVYKNQKYHY